VTELDERLSISDVSEVEQIEDLAAKRRSVVVGSVLGEGTSHPNATSSILRVDVGAEKPASDCLRRGQCAGWPEGAVASWVPTCSRSP